MNWADFKIAVAQGLVASAESVAKIISGATKVGNADKLDDKHASDFVLLSDYNTRIIGGSEAIDFNELLETKNYAFSSNSISLATNVPVVLSGILSVIKGGGYTTQVYRTTSNIVYSRTNNGSTWSLWKNDTNADTLDGYHADSFLMHDSYQYIINSLKADTDNRNVSAIPNDYNSVLRVSGLKNNLSIGLTNTGTEYSFVIGIRGWTDSSGGDAHELAFCANGKLYHRCGSTDTWKSWSVLMDSSITVPVVVSTTAPTDTTAVWIVP